MFNTSVTDALFGGSNSYSSGSIFSASNFGDLALMRSGVYKKMMRSYVSQLQEGSDDSTTAASTKKERKSTFENEVTKKMDRITAAPTAEQTKLAETNKVLSNVKSAAAGLEKSANELSAINYDTTSKEDVYQVAKSFVNSYNSMLAKASKSDNVSITQSVTWMKNDMKEHEKMLDRIGVTIGKDGSLSIDEETFTKANNSDIRTQFEGYGSVVGRIAQRATGLYNLAANQISFGSGSTLYSSAGVLK